MGTDASDTSPTPDNPTTAGGIGRFFNSVPKAIGAVTALIAAITGLVVAVSPSHKDSAGATTNQVVASDLYMIGKANDGFLTLRAEPTRSSAAVTRIPNGNRVHCDDQSVLDKQGQGYQWRHCWDGHHDGYMSDLYLQKV